MEFTVDVDLLLRNVFPNVDRDISRNSESIFFIGDYMIDSVLCSTYSYLWGMFLEDILFWGYIYSVVVAVLHN